MAPELVLSDLVALVILEKAISKFTKDDIGKEISIPYTDGGGSETTVDKVFLPSWTEMGFGTNMGIAEGSHLSKFTDNTSIIKNDFLGLYWLRSHETASATKVKCIGDDGSTIGGEADDCGYSGIAPIIVIH